MQLSKAPHINRRASERAPSDSLLPGPFPVGEYAAALQRRLRDFARVQIIGELVNLRVARAKAYFELRDASGAVPCAAWRADWERILERAGPLAEGMQVVADGGCDFYPGSATASPSFCFSVSDLRIAGDGDLLLQIERIRKALDAEGLLERQQALPLPALPRTIGVVCSEHGKARDDVRAALARRGWAGRLVWAFAPVQDRHAAPAIARALSEIAATPEIEVAIVARGGGSLPDLLCFCDEALCRTVALLRVPVIASVGHHTDRTVLDDVAAISCSTPTHAAEAAVALDCLAARRDLRKLARRLHGHAQRAALQRARALAALCRAPTEQIARQRVRLHQRLREARAGARRRVQDERRLARRRLDSLEGKSHGALSACRGSRPAELERLALALAAHDPERVLSRGYALVSGGDGGPVARAADAIRAGSLSIRFCDGSIAATVEPGSGRRCASGPEQDSPRPSTTIPPRAER